ncbi:ABC transporter permease [Mycobacterium sp. NAZ190054]|uniref:ABC transporter permease n=1 Tax=Mycobacterium sp. NAZ190054 TaxID=1747766 RepID=UPI0007996514|nr:ABC transporter permease [Mycobacterium sp. NAZ190054]KWX61371.1 hypothetical protein ASJ79_08895 [Mycobacterium sp. NAZ190054]
MTDVDVAVEVRNVQNPAGTNWFKSKVGLRAASVSLGVLMLVIWDLVVRSGTVDEIILPYPHRVAVALFAELQKPTFWEHFGVTTVETLSGFVVGSLIGFVLGAALGMSGWVRSVVFPYVVAFQGLPKVVLAPIFVTALGFGMASKIAMAVALAFFPVLLNTMVGILAVDRDQARLLQMYRATPWQTFRKLTLPAAAPMISAGLKASLTFALIGAIVGEFVGASEGLGYLLNTYAYQLKIPEVWAVMTVLAVLGVVLYWLIELADRKIVFWTGERDIPAA